jgi:hypothetical protein
VTKSTDFVQRAQRKLLEFQPRRKKISIVNKAPYFVQPRSENLGIYQQTQLKLTAFCSAAHPKI